MYKLQQEAPQPLKIEPQQYVIPRSEFCDNDYHGPLSNAEAVKMLTKEGQYLVRKSSSSCDKFFTLSLRWVLNNLISLTTLFGFK